MTTRTALAALLLASSPLLAACGGSSDESEGAAPDSSAASPSESADAGESPEADSSADSASPEDYAALLETLAEQQPAIAKSDTVEEVAQNADFPEGVEVATFDKAARQLCVQQADPAIAISIDPDTAIRALDGACEGGSEVASISQDPSDPQEVVVDGDQEVGEAVERVFLERFVGQPTG